MEKKAFKNKTHLTNNTVTRNGSCENFVAVRYVLRTKIDLIGRLLSPADITTWDPNHYVYHACTLTDPTSIQQITSVTDIHLHNSIPDLRITLDGGAV